MYLESKFYMGQGIRVSVKHKRPLKFWFVEKFNVIKQMNQVDRSKYISKHYSVVVCSNEQLEMVKIAMTHLNKASTLAILNLANFPGPVVVLDLHSKILRLSNTTSAI